MQLWRRDVLVAGGGIAAIGLIVGALRALQATPNPTIAALVLLLVVLGTATAARLRVAIAVSVIATFAFNFFLLPPLHTLRIADPQNWVVLFVFVAAANLAGHLSAAARRRAREAEARRMEVTRLFDLSRDILLTTDSRTAMADVARSIGLRFAIEAVALCLPDATGWTLHQGGERRLEPSDDHLDRIFTRFHERSESVGSGNGGHIDVGTADGQRISLVPLRLGVRPVGLLAIGNSHFDTGTLEALAGLIAIAIERAHFLQERKRGEVLRQRADLASALLASFSHDLRTPVTAVRIAVFNLRNPQLTPEEHAVQWQLAVDGLDRLTRLFQNILDMARIDAAAVSPERQWVTPADLVDAAVAYVGPSLSSRELQIEADSGSEVEVDPHLTSSALAHLLENAARYSPADRSIAVRAWTEADGVRLTVRDHGPGLNVTELDQVFEPFYRSASVRHSKGSGLGLAITRGLLAAEGGRVWGENSPDGGARFTILVPAAVRSQDAQFS